MKRLVVMVLFGLLIVALSAPVSAQVEWKSSGQIDANFMLYRNMYATGAHYLGKDDELDNNGAGYGNGGVSSGMDDSSHYFNTRGRLKLDAAAGKQVSGTMYFEMDAT